ncbi:unnamed protein product, partial [Brassica rapa]
LSRKCKTQTYTNFHLYNTSIYLLPTNQTRLTSFISLYNL